MRRAGLALLLLVLVGACAAPAPVTGPARTAALARQGTVVVVSLDGFRHDYRGRTDTPALDAMVSAGAHVGRLIPTFPSQTFPAHATLATGVHAGRHGIINNVFRDRKRGLYKHSNDVSWFDAPPLWIWAQRHGLRSHVYHWVGCEGRHHGTEPAFWTPFDKTTGDAAKVAAVGRWLRGPAAQRPRLAMVYLSGCDQAGHMYGPASAEVTACVTRNDRLVGQLLKHARVTEPSWPVTLLVVSDHGMTDTRGTANAALALRAAGVEAEVLAAGPVSHVYLQRSGDLARALEVARAIPQVKAYPRAALPAAWRYRHPTRTGDLVLVAAPGVRFDHTTSKAYTEERVRGIHGHHGHDPEHADMGAVLFAWGAGVRRGARLERARSVDLFPTVCRLLGLPLPGEQHGRVLSELLAN